MTELAATAQQSVGVSGPVAQFFRNFSLAAVPGLSQLL
jgi:hypothetical protein